MINLSQAVAQAVTETVRESILILDKDLRVEFANKSFYDTFKVVAEETEGKLIYELGNGQWNIPELKKLLEEILPQKKVFESFEVDHYFSDIGQKVMLLNARKLDQGIGSEPAILLAINDITKEKVLEQAKDEFITIAAHHLRAPLGTLRWSLELLLKDKFGKLPEKVRATLQNMFLSNLGLIALVNELLDVSRINQGMIMDHPEQVVISDLIIKLVNDLKNTAEQKSISLNLNVGNVDDLTLNLDPKLLTQAIGNVLSNAIKYSKNGSSVDISLQKETSYLKITVSDAGIGIPKKDLNKVFNKFFRAANASLSEYEGTGLGLFVVKSYLSRWRGKVSLESIEGKGTKVTINLPLKNKL